MRLKIARWGNSLGLRIPKKLARCAGLTEGARVEIDLEHGRIVVSPVQPKYRLRDLLQGMSRDEMRQAFDWGPEIGRETVSERGIACSSN